MSDKKKELDKRIEEAKQQKEELLLEEGKAYRCAECGKITMKIRESKDDEKEGLCYDCWSKKRKASKRGKLMQTFKDARVVDILPEDNPYLGINDVEKIILDVNGKRYEVVSAGYDERHIEIQEGK